MKKVEITMSDDITHHENDKHGTPDESHGDRLTLHYGLKDARSQRLYTAIDFKQID